MRQRSLETATSYLLTAIAVCLHLYYAFHAGGLWRDETNTVALATLPTLSDVSGHLQYDSFPILWPLVVRGISAIGLTADLAYRLVGCLVGLSILGALWINAAALNFRVPLISVALLGFSPPIIQWGDSMRAYGFGILLILSTFVLIWKVVTEGGIGFVAIAAVIAVASVQTLYHNAVLLFAICSAGTAMAIRQRHWSRALIVLGIGGLAAVSLIPYVTTIRQASHWNVVFSMADYDLRFFWTKLSEVLSTSGLGFRWIWVGLICVCLAIITGITLQHDRRNNNAPNMAFYCFICLLVSIPTYYLFLKMLRYPTQYWYYVALIGVVALMIDGCFSAAPAGWRFGKYRWLVALCVGLWSFVPAWKTIHVRQTNVDLAATRLSHMAEAGDTIVVHPWYIGVSFNRYYHGAASWNTVPPISDHLVHRYDLLKERMESSDPIDPLLNQLTTTLKSGKRIWIVGNLPFAPLIKPPPQLAAAPYDPVGWNEHAYTTVWALQVAHFIQTHASGGERQSPLTEQPVNRFEDVSITAIHGWRLFNQ